MDEREFDDFYAASFSRLTAQVYAMIGNRDEAQECVQEAFVRAWAHRRKLDKAEHPEAWVRTTAYRLAVSRWRRTVRGRRPADRALSLATESSAPSETHVALVEALKQLPESPAPGAGAPPHRRPARPRGGPGDRRPRGHRQGPPLPRPCRPRPAPRRRTR